MRSSISSVQRAKRLTPFEHRILRMLRSCEVVDSHLLVAVSGGVDSMTVLSILVRLQPMLQNKIAVIHVHHGQGTGVTKEQKSFRNRARTLVQEVAKQYKIRCFTIVYRGRKPLRSEEEFRDFRWQAIRNVQKKWQKSTRHSKEPYVVTGHNADDLLETRLLRLLRGTGLRGLPAMDPAVVRPLLQTSRDEIYRYAKEMELRWLEDPSNANVGNRRNWLRKVWLPLLKEAWPSAELALARSLATIASEGSRLIARHQTVTKGLVIEERISRPKYLALSRDEKTACLADYLITLGIHDFTQGQIYEISRRLDSPRRRFTFRAVRQHWVVTPSEIRAKLES